MMSLTFGLFTQVSGSGPLGPLVGIVFEGKTYNIEQLPKTVFDLLGSFWLGKTTIQLNYYSIFCLLNTVELQWLKHQWLVYHGCSGLVLESLEIFSMTADIA